MCGPIEVCKTSTYDGICFGIRRMWSGCFHYEAVSTTSVPTAYLRRVALTDNLIYDQDTSSYANGGWNTPDGKYAAIMVAFAITILWETPSTTPSPGTQYMD